MGALATIKDRERRLTTILAKVFAGRGAAEPWFAGRCASACGESGGRVTVANSRPFHFEHQPWNGKRRETDILVIITRESGRQGCALIEVKIDAEFGYGQADDYVKRAQHIVASKRYPWAITVLIAPRAYLCHPLAAAFNVVIPLEQVRDGIGKTTALSAEDLEFLSAACVHVYVQVPDPVNSAFWARYAGLQFGEFPELTITNYPPDGRGKGGQAIDVYFNSAVKRWPVKHSLENCAVMFELLGRRYLEPAIRDRLARHFPANWRLVSPRSGRRQPDGTRGTSIHIVTEAPLVISTNSFEEQIPQIRSGLTKVREMMQWSQLHASELIRTNAESKPERGLSLL